MKWPYLTPALLTLFLLWARGASAAAPPTEEPPIIIVTSTPTPSPTMTSTPTATATPDYGQDPYEVDSWDAPPAYTGKMWRTFSPVGDVDYALYHVKAGVTEIYTLNLAGAADTYLELYDAVTGELLGRDDDGGGGLASYVSLTTTYERDVRIVVSNRAVGYGPSVTYDLVIVPQADFTPTPTAVPTKTPIPQPTTQATWTPQPTYTPYPTPVPPTPRPAGPRPTSPPATQFVLRVEVFTDADNDQLLDVGEGVEQVMVEVSSLAGDYAASGYTTAGVFVLELLCPLGKPPIPDLVIAVPYLQETQVLADTTGMQGTVVVSFALEAPLLPIQLP